MGMCENADILENGGLISKVESQGPCVCLFMIANNDRSPAMVEAEKDRQSMICLCHWSMKLKGT